MDLLNKRLKASTLAETLIAMVIIMLSFGTATVIFSNVTRSSSLPQKIKAETLLKELAIQSKQEKVFLDASFQFSGMLIHKRVSPYAGSTSLSLLNIQALDLNGKKIAVFNELVMTE